jgi:hypothetical protein
MIVGIDPGKTGGIVTITRQKCSVIDLMVMPEHPQELIGYLEELVAASPAGGIHVFIEKAQAMPKNGAVSMFNYGVGYGQLQGILLALKLPHTLVPPKTWTKVMHAGASGTEPKKKSLEVAHRLFPGQNLRDPGSMRAQKPHEGIVDALLIAEYGRRLFGAA